MLGNANKGSKVFKKRETYITEDYGMFTQLPGNRNVDPAHVKNLVRQIEKNGNLIDKFPIVVNSDMQILDGQHRFEALRQLKEPVVYEIRENVNIDEVRNINTTHKNWGWKDYAVSYADLGNDNYARLLNLHQHFGYGYGILLAYCGATIDKRRSQNFYNGHFEMKDQEHAFKMLKQYQQIEELIPVHAGRDLALALRDIMSVKEYNHARMVEKIRKFGSKKLINVRGKTEYERLLEDIYNTNVTDTEKARLF